MSLRFGLCEWHFQVVLKNYFQLFVCQRFCFTLHVLRDLHHFLVCPVSQGTIQIYSILVTADILHIYIHKIEIDIVHFTQNKLQLLSEIMIWFSFCYEKRCYYVMKKRKNTFDNGFSKTRLQITGRSLSMILNLTLEFRYVWLRNEIE